MAQKLLVESNEQASYSARWFSGGVFLLSDKARGRQDIFSESVKLTQIINDSELLQYCSVCYGASVKDGLRQRVSPKRNFNL